MPPNKSLIAVAKTGTHKHRRYRRMFVPCIIILVTVIATRHCLVQFTAWKAFRALHDRDVANAGFWLRFNHLLAAENAETAFLQARILRREGDSDGFRQALAKADRYGCSKQQLSREQILMLAQLGQLRGVEHRLKELLINPGEDGREICEAFVTGYVLNHRLDEASLILETWVSAFPNDAQPHLFRGKIKSLLHDYTGATADLHNAIKRDPSLVEAHFELGLVYVEQGQLDDAATNFKLATRDPKFQQRARVKLAMCLSRQSKYAQATQLLSEVLENEPRNAEALLERGKLRLLDGKPAEAIRDLQVLVEIAPNLIEARFQLGVALTQVGHSGEATPHLAFTDVGQSEMQQAERLTDRVAEHPDDINARYEAAMIFLKYGQDEKALHWLRSILNYSPQDLRTIQSLTEWYTKKSKEHSEYRAAAQSYQQLLNDISPSQLESK